MTIKVFMSGQSNALGLNSGGPAWSTVSSDVRVWNNINPLGANGTAFVTAAAAQAAGVFDYTDHNNFGPWFCDKLARTKSTPVDLTAVVRGASTIQRWSPDEVEFPMLQECIDVWAATWQGPADVFLWHQGESNTGTDHAVYSELFEELVLNLTAGGVIDENTLILIGGLVGSNANKENFNTGALQRLAIQPRRAYANSYLIPTSDGTHFTGDGLTAMGAIRYYNAYLFAAARALL